MATTPTNPDDDWQKMWNAREASLKAVLGATDGNVLHAIVPFYLGGSADVLCFPNHVAGRVYTTCELLGESSQKKNQLGNYELMVARRDGSKWGPNIIAKLARYTCDAVLEKGQTMDLATAVPKGSTIAAFFFVEYSRFKFQENNAGLLLCIGITADELAACRQGKQEQVFQALKAANVYPFTDLFRASTLTQTKGGLWRRMFGGGK